MDQLFVTALSITIHEMSFFPYVTVLAPFPLSIFENSECSSFEYTPPITTIFCTRHDSDTVVTCAKYRCDRPRIYVTPECYEFSPNIEFDRNMLCGTGAWCLRKFLLCCGNASRERISNAISILKTIRLLYMYMCVGIFFIKFWIIYSIRMPSFLSFMTRSL